ncbi:MAG: hypothetical protein JSV41_11005 [Gemmatimonadota bacterium]|nr:MAG: hypothetical protein JSV41_11005 [Gemmatimonadota bacterium]
MRQQHLILCTVMALAITAGAPARLPAQQAKVDSLEARIRELEARLDSLMAALTRGEAPPRVAQTAEAELAALRAAAQAAAGEHPAPDTAGPQESRTRNLNILNPEISVTGDIVGSYTNPAAGADNVSAVPREFEFAFQAPLDPYTHTKIFVARHAHFDIAGFPGEEGEHEHGFEIEEGYMYWVGLPIGLKIGKFRQEIGLYNRWHTHALMEVNRALPSVAFLGGDGLIQVGAAVTLPTVTLGSSTQTLTLELTRANNAALFEGGNEIGFLGNFQSFWDLGPSSYVQFAATGVYGENDDESLASRLLEFDVAYRWRPTGRAMYRDFTLKGEWYFAEKDFGVDELTGNGGTLQANLRLNRRWIVGARADYLDGYGDGAEIIQVVPSLTWWQSEWVFLRLQYNYLKPDDGKANHTVLLQTVWAVGPHKHETY